MKKSLLTIAFLTVSATAFAAIESEVELCRIAVHSGTASTIISLPLEAVGGADIKVKDLVLTDNLTANDTLFATIDGVMYGWKLNSNKEWEGAAVNEGGSTIQAGADQTLERGTAIWVNRTGTLNDPFYLYGQVNPSTSGSQSITAGKTESDKNTYAYTLVGNPNPTDVKLNDGSKITWTGAQVGDKIVWGSTGGLGVNIYTYYDNAWGHDVKNDEGKYVWTTEITLPAGQGFWYVANGVGDRSVEWK